NLHQAVVALPAEVGRDEQEIRAAIQALAALSGPIDQFFESVVVNADDKAVRANRLALLGAVRARMKMIADFNQLEG
ncbi:MAG: DALR anticodon-binding domain-containing protein, partial [Pseudomonadota bacterium]|nr:DALR anticodon-binding domain-containing protein [Pseudomonadota bacterium]